MLISTKQKGVTLIELLIVVIIIAALSAIAIPRISQSATNAKAKACNKNIDIINTSIELFSNENGSYPANLQGVTKDTAYFPDGEPSCPITEKMYPKDLKNNRVDASAHAH